MKQLEFGSRLQSHPVWAYLRTNSEPVQRRVSTGVALALVAMSGWTLGQVAWLVYPVDNSVVQWQAPSPSRGAQTNAEELLNLAPLKAANLFGNYQPQKAPVVEEVVVTEAPETRLNLVLVGAVSSTVPQTSLAVIANRGQQATYGIGEAIEGTRATLKAVFVDRVIIDNQGRDETLMLEGIDYSKTPVALNRNSGSSAKGNASVSDEQIAQARKEIATNPQAIFQYVRLSPVKKDNKVVGYRVSPGKNASLFDGVGLQSGDIAVQLNGSDLTDPAAMAGIYKTITEQNELNLTVERDGQQHDIYIQF